MEIGIVGLGRMGANIARRLMRDGHTCVVYDVSPEVTAALGEEGANPASDLADLASKLTAPRAVWVMVPAGEITETTLLKVGDVLESGDAVIDGGNSYYRDDIRLAAKLADGTVTKVIVDLRNNAGGNNRTTVPETIKHPGCLANSRPRKQQLDIAECVHDEVAEAGAAFVPL